MSDWTGEADKSRWNSRNLFWKYHSHAHVYTDFISRKKHSLLHMTCVFLWFPSVSSVKGLAFKVFTRFPKHSHWLPKHSHGLWTLVKGWKSKPSHRKTASQSGGKRYERSAVLWMLEKQSLHTKTTENQPENAFVWRSECFFADKKTYKGGWTVGVVNGKLLRGFFVGVIQLPLLQ